MKTAIVLILAAVATTSGRRLQKRDSTLSREKSDSNDQEQKKADFDDSAMVLNEEDEAVDFSFMTTDTRYPSHESGFFGTVKEWFGGRATSDEVKEDIVTGHTCQKKGTPDESYYASSFCYWVPEFTTQSSSHGGLVWRGGNYRNGKRLSSKVNARGKCVKSSVCHDNAHSDDGDVAKTSFVEELQLPADCMKESAIEAECVGQYDLANGAIRAEDSRCQEVHGRHSRAVEQWNKCNSQLISLPQQINVILPQQIQRARNEVSNAQMRLQQARGYEQQERHRMSRRCERYQREKGNQYWMGMLLGATPTEQILNQMHTFHCQYPRRFDNHDGNHHDENMRHQHGMSVYHACQECERAKRQLDRAYRQTTTAQSAVYQKSQVEPRLHQQINTYRHELSQWQSQQPGIEHAKQAMDSEWLPQSSACMQTFSDYKNGKAQAVTKCAPTFYENSCEKECIEQALDGGCGVAEGLRASDNGGVGGVEVTCDPIQPSWVMAPFTYGAHEDKEQQCKRIEANQRAQYATKILKSGWLWKKGRVNGWDRRYFQLESGDAVRSAVLRYWTEDPTHTSKAEQRPNKGIIIRDAKRVKAKSGEHYGFKEGEECFKLYHFYRDYRLCVTTDVLTTDMEFPVSPIGSGLKGSGSGSDLKDSRGGPETDRDEWMNFIEESILS